MADSDQHIQKAVRSSIQAENKARRKDMKASMAKLKDLMMKTGPVAEQQTILRNGKEALSQQGRWVEMDFMIRLQSIVEKEGWARLESLQARLQLNDTMVKIFFNIIILYLIFKYRDFMFQWLISYYGCEIGSCILFLPICRR